MASFRLTYLVAAFVLFIRVHALAKTITGTIVVNATTGVELSYIDSGPPPNKTTVPYTTIVAIHGMIFTDLVFQNMINVAPAHGIRVVAFNRRPFAGSTPFTPEEFNITMLGGTTEQLDAQMEARGHEIATFIDVFIQKNNIPPVTTSGGTAHGGVVILGWSVGAWCPLAAIASTTTLPADVQARLGAHIRSAILYEPAPLVVGLPDAPEQWTPLQDTSFSANLTLPAFGQYVTAFFEHGDLSKKDPALLSWVLPSTNFVPTIFTIDAATLAVMTTYGTDAQTDLPFLANFQSQLLAVYRKTFFDPTIAKNFPFLKRSVLSGIITPAFAITGLWAIQDDVAANPGPAPVTFKFINGSNHFLHWVDPNRAISVFLDLA